MSKKIITQSFIGNFRDCPQYAYQHNVLGRIPNNANTVARDIGSAVHSGLEVWFRSGDATAALAALELHKPNLDQLDYLKALAMLGGYFKRWENPFTEFEVHHVEKEFAFDIPNTDYEFRGKIDVLLRDRRTGEWQLWDHKTSSRVDGDYILKRWMDLQLNAYAIGASESLGLDIGSFVYDILSKPELKLKKTETHPEFFARLTEECSDPSRYMRQPYTKEDLRVDETRKQIAGWIGSIIVAQETGFWGENTSNCFKWGRACEYWPLCISNRSALVADNGYTLQPVNPELTASIKEETE